jgi:hypothetical protein
MPFSGLFTQVRGRRVLRTSGVRSSAKFTRRTSHLAYTKLVHMGDAHYMRKRVSCLVRGRGTEL